MMKISLVLIAALTILLSGCGLFGDTFRNRGSDYQLSEEMSPIEVPKGMDKDAIGEIYPVPAIPDDSVVPGDFEVPRPERPALTSFEKQVKIQTLNDKRWALVQASPSEVWPRLRNVLNRNAIPAATTDASKGILETVWVNFKDDDANVHRFRFHIEPGVQPNTAEVSILQNQVATGAEETAVWPKESDDKKREKEVLKLVSETLAGDFASNSVSLLAQSIGGDAKVEVVNSSKSDPYILVKLDFERAWASVAYSVERDGFTIIDQDRSAGVFYVNYIKEEDEPGFLKRWFTSDDEEDPRTVKHQVKVKRGDDGMRVSISGPEGEPMGRNEALALLKIIRSNLS